MDEYTEKVIRARINSRQRLTKEQGEVLLAAYDEAQAEINRLKGMIDDGLLH